MSMTKLDNRNRYAAANALKQRPYSRPRVLHASIAKDVNRGMNEAESKAFAKTEREAAAVQQAAREEAARREASREAARVTLKPVREVASSLEVES